MTQRQSQILHIIAKERKVDVSFLSDQFGVSPVTIRKDLTALEDAGLVKRLHGYAVLNAETDISNRMAIHYERKVSLVKRACELVDDGDVIMLESGSCCALLAERINETRKNVTMITYSAYIATHIEMMGGNQIILIGGTVLQESKNTVGPIALASLSNFSVQKFFTGTDGITADGWFTAKDMMIAEVIREMSSRARKTILMTDSSKFSRQGTVTIFPASKVYAVYTDDRCTAEMKAYLQEQGCIVNTGEEEEKR